MLLLLLLLLLLLIGACVQEANAVDACRMADESGVHRALLHAHRHRHSTTSQTQRGAVSEREELTAMQQWSNCNTRRRSP